MKKLEFDADGIAAFMVDGKKFLIQSIESGFSVRVLNEDSDFLFSHKLSKTDPVKELENYIQFFEAISEQYYQLGKRAGQKEIKQKIAEVVGFFAAGFLKEDGVK